MVLLRARSWLDLWTSWASGRGMSGWIQRLGLKDWEAAPLFLGGRTAGFIKLHLVPARFRWRE